MFYKFTGNWELNIAWFRTLKGKIETPTQKDPNFSLTESIFPNAGWEAETLSSSMILLGTCRPYLCANEFEGKHVLMILLQTLKHKILQKIILKSDYAIKRLGGLTRMEKVLQQLWICKILVRQNLHKDRTIAG